MTALAEHESRLTREFERATATRVVLTAAAQSYAAQFQRQFPAQPLPRPAFLPAELQRLETYLSKESDATLQQHYLVLYQEALATERGNEFAPHRAANHALIELAKGSATDATNSPTESLSAYLPRANAPSVSLADLQQREAGLER